MSSHFFPDERDSDLWKTAKWWEKGIVIVFVLAVVAVAVAFMVAMWTAPSHMTKG